MSASDAFANDTPGRTTPFRLRPEERGVVVFHLLPSLSYRARWALGLALVFAGLLVQIATGAYGYGAPLILAGSLLFCVKGYHNRVEVDYFDPSADWEPVEPDRLDELIELDRRMLRWNRSAMDITHSLGFLSLVAVVGPVALFIYLRQARGFGAIPWSLEALWFNAAILLLPHWITGTRRILRLPALMVKVELLKAVLDAVREEIEDQRVSVLMLLRGKHRLPDDAKARIQPAAAPEGFLGLYVQVVTNDVNGTTYPYLYVVLVSRKGLGLARAADGQPVPKGLVLEYPEQEDVDVVVLRQQTTKTSGYHTALDRAIEIVLAGLELSNAAVAGISAPGANT